MAGNLTGQVRNIADVTDRRRQRRPLQARSPVDVKGEILELKDTINTMVDQLNSFASGSDRGGPRGGHRRKARRPGRRPRLSPAPGRDLTDSVNMHGRQPHRPGPQHRRSDTAVANGDLSQQITWT
jgi:hypothetical protein